MLTPVIFLNFAMFLCGNYRNHMVYVFLSCGKQIVKLTYYVLTYYHTCGTDICTFYSNCRAYRCSPLHYYVHYVHIRIAYRSQAPFQLFLDHPSSLHIAVCPRHLAQLCKTYTGTSQENHRCAVMLEAASLSTFHCVEISHRYFYI